MVQFCRSAPFGNQNWSISGPVQGGGIRFPEDRGGVEATRRVKLNGAENENRYKNSQKRSEMFGPVGFPKGKWVGCASAAATRNQNWSKTGPVLGGVSFAIRRGVHCR